MTTQTISKQILSKIELRKLSIYDLNRWEDSLGQSFIHFYGSLIDFKIFTGFILSKEPSLNDEIFTLINLNNYDIQEFSSILELKYPLHGLSVLKNMFLDFINLTNFTRKKFIYIIDNEISYNIEWIN